MKWFANFTLLLAVAFVTAAVTREVTVADLHATRVDMYRMHEQVVENQAELTKQFGQLMHDVGNSENKLGELDAKVDAGLRLRKESAAFYDRIRANDIQELRRQLARLEENMATDIARLEQQRPTPPATPPEPTTDELSDTARAYRRQLIRQAAGL